MPTIEHGFKYSQSMSTTTKCGWDVSGLFGYAQGVGNLVLNGDRTTNEASWLEYGGAVVVGVNALTTDTITTTTGYSDIATSFLVPVPPGCKATVTQSLSKVIVSGEYKLHALLGKGSKLNFTAAAGSANKHTDYSGYVNITDLIKNSSIPQNFISIESNGDIALNASGMYEGEIIKNVSGSTNTYDVHVEYTDALAETHSCVPPTIDSFENDFSN